MLTTRNSGNYFRSRLTYGLSSGGFGGAIGSGITGAFTGGLGAAAGALIGAPIGFAIGFFVGPYVDGLHKNKVVFTQGGAREYLINKRKEYPSLSLEKIIEVTKYPPDNKGIYTFLIDNVIKCTKEDIYKWLKDELWKD